MKIIDFHTHIWPDDLAPKALEKLIQHSPMDVFTDGTRNGLLQSMKRASISRSVLLSIATKPAQVVPINRGCLSLQTDSTIPFGTLHPQYDGNHDEIDWLIANNVKGIKFHPEYQDFYMSDPKHFEMYDHLQSSGLIVLFHTGKDPGPFTCDHGMPAAVKQILKQFPRMKLVAAHMGGWKLWKESEELLCGLPLYFDTSAISNLLDGSDFVRMVRKHGAERILFGTDSPWYDQKSIIDWILALSLTDKEKELILSKNALELLELPT